MASQSSNKKNQFLSHSRCLNSNPLTLTPFLLDFQHKNLPAGIDRMSPYEIFTLFFNNEVLEALALRKNQYAAYYYMYEAPEAEEHPEAELEEYCNQDTRVGPVHPQISNAISVYRWEQIERLTHLSYPYNPSTKPPRESSYTKLRLRTLWYYYM